MTQSGQGNEPRRPAAQPTRPAYEGIVLPADGEPFDPADLRSAPSTGQPWGEPWGPDAQSAPGQGGYPGQQPEPGEGGAHRAGGAHSAPDPGPYGGGPAYDAYGAQQG
ncbi:hypothetical protein ACFU99_30720, partial [Streptomyces sp. NPDC057654]